jgi:hypothetical protein
LLLFLANWSFRACTSADSNAIASTKLLTRATTPSPLSGRSTDLLFCRQAPRFHTYIFAGFCDFDNVNVRQALYLSRYVVAMYMV